MNCCCGQSMPRSRCYTRPACSTPRSGRRCTYSRSKNLTPTTNWCQKQYRPDMSTFRAHGSYAGRNESY